MPITDAITERHGESSPARYRKRRIHKLTLHLQGVQADLRRMARYGRKVMLIPQCTMKSEAIFPVGEIFLTP